MKGTGWVLSGLVLSALFVATEGTAARSTSVVAKLERAAGPVTLTRNGQTVAAKSGMDIESGDRIKTEEGAALIKFQDDTLLRLRTRTEVEIKLSGKDREISLFAGKLAAFIAKMREGQTSFRAGSTIAAVRGTKIEEWFDGETGEYRIGVVEGTLHLTFVLNGVEQTLDLPAGKMATFLPDQAPVIGDFKEGDIAPPDKTQCQYAVEIVRNVGLEAQLPTNATEEDAMNLLASLGILPCDGYWECDKPLSLADIKCVLGLAPDAPIFVIPLEEQVKLIMEKCAECWWILTRKKVPVSPFAP